MSAIPETLTTPTNVADWLITLALSIWGLICALLDPGLILTVLSIMLVLLKVIHEAIKLRRTLKHK